VAPNWSAQSTRSAQDVSASCFDASQQIGAERSTSVIKQYSGIETSAKSSQPPALGRFSRLARRWNWIET
jgi:hypothetical protein